MLFCGFSPSVLPFLSLSLSIRFLETLVKFYYQAVQSVEHVEPDGYHVSQPVLLKRFPVLWRITRPRIHLVDRPRIHPRHLPTRREPRLP